MPGIAENTGAVESAAGVRAAGAAKEAGTAACAVGGAADTVVEEGASARAVKKDGIQRHNNRAEKRKRAFIGVLR